MSIDDVPLPKLQQSLRARPWLRLFRRFLNGFGITLALAWAVMHGLEALSDNPIGVSHYGSRLVNWNHRRDEVKKAFVTSWDAYAQNAWGRSSTCCHRSMPG